MNKKLILALLIFALILGTVFLIRTNQNSFSQDEILNNINNADSNQQNSKTNLISLEELANHNSMEDC